EAAAFLLAREGEAEKLLCPCGDGALPRLGGAKPRPHMVSAILRLIHYYVVSIALRGKISVHYFRLEPTGGYHILFQLLLDRTVLLFNQARVIFLRRGLQLPLVLEEC